MPAKSAPQLLHVHHSRSVKRHLRDGLVVTALAMLMAGSAWLLEPQVSPAHVAGSQRHADEPAATEPVLTAAPAHALVVPENNHHRALSEFLSKRYRVSQAMTLDLVAIAHAAGQQIGLDPLLIIAVMAVESRFNPIAESVAGAKGLMQVIPKYHTEKFREFGRDKSVFDPETNILVGSQILKEYWSRTGSLNTALQLYVGASRDENDNYIGKVMNEKQRLQQVLRRSSSRPDVEASLAGARLAFAAPRP